MTPKKDITHRDDVKLLVHTFYDKIRVHDVLGPIFNSIITHWDAHLLLLTNFWESQLFLQKKYHGNPITAHQKVDAKTKGTITNEHFGLWLNTWYATIDELFEGETAWIAKNRAQKMSTMLYIKMFESRKKP